MIEVTVKEVDGVRFISSAKIVEPRDKKDGVFVEYMGEELLHYPGIQLLLKSLGLRKVGYSFERKAIIYAQYPISYFRYKITSCAVLFFWKTSWWLYDNARMFQLIPSGETFSWTYFTPYVWCKLLRGKIRKS